MSYMLSNPSKNCHSSVSTSSVLFLLGEMVAKRDAILQKRMAYVSLLSRTSGTGSKTISSILALFGFVLFMGLRRPIA